MASCMGNTQVETSVMFTVEEPDENYHQWLATMGESGQGAASGSGTYPPTVGLEVTADGASWLLTAEYRESNAAPWKPSEMMIQTGLERVAIRALIGAEDPLPSRDFEDIQWDAAYLDGTMLEIPYRPYAVRTDDLF